MPKYKVYGKKDFSRTKVWVLRLQKMLGEAGLDIPSGPPDYVSPVHFVYQEVDVDAATLKPVKEWMLSFGIRPWWPQGEIEAVFSPYKAEVMDFKTLLFKVPLAAAEKWLAD